MIKQLLKPFWKKSRTKNWQTRKLGLFKDRLDERDYLADPINSGFLENVTKKLSLFSNDFAFIKPTSIKQQGTLSSCGSHAILCALEIINRDFYHRDLDLSELYHYYFTRKLNGSFPKDEGMSLRDGLKALVQYGVSLESFWPYNISKTNVEPSWLSQFTGRSFRPLLMEYYRVLDVNEIKACLSAGIPVIAGFGVTQAFMNAKDNSLINDTALTKQKEIGGHAVCLIGYDKDCLIFQNSWGSWDVDGLGSVTYEYAKKHGWDFWVLKVKQ